MSSSALGLSARRWVHIRWFERRLKVKRNAVGNGSGRPQHGTRNYATDVSCAMSALRASRLQRAGVATPLRRPQLPIRMAGPDHAPSEQFLALHGHGRWGTPTPQGRTMRSSVPVPGTRHVPLPNRTPPEPVHHGPLADLLAPRVLVRVMKPPAFRKLIAIS